MSNVTFFSICINITKRFKVEFFKLARSSGDLFYIFVLDSGDSYRSSSQNDLDSSAVASI